jgi:hypothetical protein
MILLEMTDIIAEKIYKNFNNTIKNSFSKIIKIITNAEPIDSTSFYALFRKNKLKCICKNPIDIKKGEMVVITGWINIDSLNFGIHLDVEKVYPISEYEKIEQLSKPYKQIVHQLKKEKYRKIIKNIRSIKFPNKIMNIGLISFNVELDKAIELFKTKCYGKLYVFKMKDNDITVPMDYFKRYVDIDVAIILTKNSDYLDRVEISSIENVRYLIRNSLYLISISSGDHYQSLTSVLSNKNFESIEKAIESIVQVQQNNKTKLTNMIKKDRDKLNKLSKNLSDMFLEIKFYLAEMSDPSFVVKSDNLTKFELIKMNILLELKNNLCIMYANHMEIMKYLCETTNEKIEN